MSEPKIIDIVYPPVYGVDSYKLFDDPALFDGYLTPTVQSTGGGTDGQFVYGQFGDGLENVDFTGVLLLNHNCKFGAANYTVNRHGLFISGKTTHEVTDPATSYRHTLIKFPKTDSWGLNVGFSLTEPANQLKEVGELVLFNENTITLSRDFTAYEERWANVAREIMLETGGVHRVVQVSTPDTSVRYEARAEFNFMTEAEMESMRGLFRDGQTFTFMPESETNPHKYYECHLVAPLGIKYTSSYKGAGYTVSVTIRGVA